MSVRARGTAPRAASRSPWKNIKRLIRYRLVIPLKRGAGRPSYTARGTAVGIFWAFTPLIPAQMYLLGLTWLVARPFPRLAFNPVIALAWVWVTNWVTIVPVYFVFYVTGQMLLGHWDDLLGYTAFAADWQRVILETPGVLEIGETMARLLVRGQGLALAVGCLPYALGGAWLGYTWSFRVIKRYQHFGPARATNKRPRRAPV